MDIKWEEVGRHNDRECSIVYVEGLGKNGNRFQASADVWGWEEARVIDPIADAHIQTILEEQIQASGIELLDELKLKFINGAIDLNELSDILWNSGYNACKEDLSNKPKKEFLSERFLADLDFIVDNIGYDIVKKDSPIDGQKEYHKRLKMMRSELYEGYR